MKMKKYLNFILTAILVFIVIGLLILIKTGYIVGFDNAVFNFVTINENLFLENMYKTFTFLASTTFIVIVCILIILFLKNKKMALCIVGTVIISTIVNNVLKLIIRRERPLVRRLVEEKSFSFPSGHTMAATTLYGILIFFVMKSKMNKKTRISISIVLGIMPICVALSRVYLGAHYASDVTGGIITSTALLLFETYFFNKWDGSKS